MNNSINNAEKKKIFFLTIIVFALFLLTLTGCMMTKEQRSTVINFDINDQWKNHSGNNNQTEKEPEITVYKKGYGREEAQEK